MIFWEGQRKRIINRQKMGKGQFQTTSTSGKLFIFLPTFSYGEYSRIFFSEHSILTFIFYSIQLSFDSFLFESGSGNVFAGNVGQMRSRNPEEFSLKENRWIWKWILMEFSFKGRLWWWRWQWWWYEDIAMINTSKDRERIVIHCKIGKLKENIHQTMKILLTNWLKMEKL